MLLSEVPIEAKWNEKTRLYENNIDSSLAEKIVFQNIIDEEQISFYGIVFGTSRKIEMIARIQKAIHLYKMGRIKKLILTGGKSGISSKKKNQTPDKIVKENNEISYLIQDGKSEAERMKEIALSDNVPITDIIVNDYSNDTIENIKYLKDVIEVEKITNLVLISSAYHLKRCLAVAKMYLSKQIHYDLVIAPTGYFELDNYQNTSLGIQLIQFEANHLVNLARKKVIEDLEIE